MGPSPTASQDLLVPLSGLVQSDSCQLTQTNDDKRRPPCARANGLVPVQSRY